MEIARTLGLSTETVSRVIRGNTWPQAYPAYQEGEKVMAAMPNWQPRNAEESMAKFRAMNPELVKGLDQPILGSVPPISPGEASPLDVFMSAKGVADPTELAGTGKLPEQEGAKTDEKLC